MLSRCQLCMDMHKEDSTHPVFSVPAPIDSIGKALYIEHFREVHNLEVHLFQMR